MASWRPSQRLTITHVRRWQEHRGYAGLGHVYQGRYKSFPVESDEHFWVVARYVESNAMRANLVLRAEEWRWSSLWQRCHPRGEERSLLAARPIDITPARKFRMLLHINPTRQRGKRTGSLARALGWYMTFFAAGVICRRIGSSGSIKPTTRRNWKRFAAACNEAAPLASRNGRRKSRNAWA